MSNGDSCVYRLRQGKYHWKYSPGSYGVCITRTQHEKLFGPCGPAACAPPPKLGCGTFGCVYPHKDPDKVVKITRDESDATGMLVARRRGVPNLVDVHAVYRLKNDIFWKTYQRPLTGQYGFQSEKAFYQMTRPYAMVVEKLRPLDAHWTRRVKCAEQTLDFALRTRNPLDLKLTRQKLRQLWKCCPRSTGAERRVCHRGIFSIADTYVKLARVGLPWSDLSRQNLGVDRQGRWKVLDLGVGPTRDRDEVEELAGARGARRRKRYGR